MPLYESTFIARPDISAQQVEALTEQFEEIIRTAGGEVAKKEYWGLRNLAYRIKKNRKGHYTYLNLDAPSDAIQEMERTMRISEDVIRYMTVRVNAFEEGPSAVMQTRGSRDGGRGRSDRGGFGDRGRERSDSKSDVKSDVKSDTKSDTKSDGDHAAAGDKPAAPDAAKTEATKSEASKTEATNNEQGA